MVVVVVGRGVELCIWKMGGWENRGWEGYLRHEKKKTGVGGNSKRAGSGKNGRKLQNNG